MDLFHLINRFKEAINSKSPNAQRLHEKISEVICGKDAYSAGKCPSSEQIIEGMNGLKETYSQGENPAWTDATSACLLQQTNHFNCLNGPDDLLLFVRDRYKKWHKVRGTTRNESIHNHLNVFLPSNLGVKFADKYLPIFFLLWNLRAMIQYDEIWCDRMILGSLSFVLAIEAAALESRAGILETDIRRLVPQMTFLNFTEQITFGLQRDAPNILTATINSVHPTTIEPTMLEHNTAVDIVERVLYENNGDAAPLDTSITNIINDPGFLEYYNNSDNDDDDDDNPVINAIIPTDNEIHYTDYVPASLVPTITDASNNSSNNNNNNNNEQSSVLNGKNNFCFPIIDH